MSFIVKKENRVLSALIFSINPFNLLCLIAWGSVLLGFWAGVNNKIPVLKAFTEELKWLIVLVPLVLSFAKIIYKLKVIDIFFFAGCLLFYLLNYIIYPDNQQALEQHFFQFSFLALPYFLYGVIVDINKFLKPFFYVSILSITVCSFYEFFYLKGGNSSDIDTSQYNMALAYNMLQHVMLVSWVSLKEMRLWQFPFMLLGIFLLFSLGTRGPILCLFLFLALYLLVFKQMKHKYLIRALVVSIAIIVMLYSQQIALYFQLVMQRIGMSTRIFDKYLTEEIGISEVRDVIKDKLFYVLSCNTSGLGFGLCGSYKFVNTYPHNLLLEFWFSFGWVIGTLLLLILFILIFKTYISCRHSSNQVVFLTLLICGSIIKLLLSGTFLDDALFFMLIGFCINTLRHKNKMIV